MSDNNQSVVGDMTERYVERLTGNDLSPQELTAFLSSPLCGPLTTQAINNALTIYEEDVKICTCGNCDFCMSVRPDFINLDIPEHHM